MKSTSSVKFNKGFSLLEISIALTIIGILTYGLAGSFNKVDDFEDYQTNQKFMEKVQESLLTFAQVNRFLPCPDTDNDGRENRAATADLECVSEEGRFPYLDLGVAANDVWNAPLYYAVNNRADSSDISDPDESASYFGRINTPAPVFNYNTPPFGSDRATGNYTVCSETATVCSAATPGTQVIESAAIAVVISFGKNGLDTWSKIASNNEGALGSAEEENADDDNYFWIGRGSNLEGQEFDDQLFWVNGYDVKYAIIKSGGTL